MANRLRVPPPVRRAPHADREPQTMRMGATVRLALTAVMAGACIACLGPGPGAAATVPSAARLSVAARPRQADQPDQGWRVITRVTVPGKTVVMLSVASDSANDAWATGIAGQRPVI